MSDDKVGTGITETTALSSMFIGEGFMKKHFNDVFNEKNISGIAKKFTDYKILKPLADAVADVKIAGKIGAVIKGVTFVGGSMASYALGQSFGVKYAEKIKSSLGIADKKINQKT